MGKEVRIVGGGLAGLTLGLLLRRANVPVQIWDAGSYPRQKVCGEFMSGRGIEILRMLELPGIPEPLGNYARTLQFFDSAGSSHFVQLPEPALAIDRARLDHLLASEFRKAGGLLRENERWTGSFAAEGVVRATGRRLHKSAGSGFVGVKVHARNLQLGSDLELHFSDEGYVGLSRHPKGVVNVCALFRNGTRLRTGGRRSNEHLRELLARNMGNALGQRLSNAEFDENTFSAVAGISLNPDRCGSRDECRIGDSICMIPPMTGNGMSIALESAVMAAPILRDYSSGQLNWPQAVGSTSQSCEKLLRRRLTSAAWLQKLCFSRAGRMGLLCMLRTVPKALNAGFWLTR